MHEKTSITQAVVLAGGRGERLRPITDAIPKPMVAIHGRPFLEYLVALLKKNGITDIVMCLGYLSKKITEHFGDGSRFGLRIRYSVGAVVDETGTRLRNAWPLLDDRFLLLYCDNYWPLDLIRMEEFYHSKGALASATVYANADGRGEYGFENNICVDGEGYVLRYDKTRAHPDLNGVDIGFFLLDKRALDLIPAGNVSFEQAVLPRLVAQRQLVGFRTDTPYYTITSVDFLRRAEQAIASLDL